MNPWYPKLHGNRGNIVNRIGLAHRRMAYAWCITGVMTFVAIVGWTRPINKIIAERPIVGMNESDCMEYAETMCNK